MPKWGDSEEEPRGSGEGHDQDLSAREPDERTRLLASHPRPPRSDGYLDPDDPAVSPYNLWTIRFLRYLTVLFLFITLIWWILLLVSVFASPPGFQSRGSGFTHFSFTCLTIGNILVSLLFFASPSQAMRILAAVVSLFLLVDMILILAVSKLRIEEGWVGIASVVWAFLISVWCITVDRVVAWGKQEEEERLTGRPETRRTAREWLSVLISTIILSVFIAIVVLLTATLSLRARDSSLRMQGQKILVDDGKYAVHLACVGNATNADGKPMPTILLEAGEGTVEYGLEPWAYNCLKNGTISRYCYWDRPGYAWSDNAPSPHSAGMTARALMEALAIAGEDGPWVLVSAGKGSIVSRIFSSNNGHRVSGLMLIDPLHEDLLYRFASPGTGFWLWAWGIISPLGIDRLVGAFFRGRTREDRIYGRSAYQSGRFIKAELQESLVADSFTKQDISSARVIQDRSAPLVVMSSGVRVRKDSAWEKKQNDLTTITDNLVVWDVVPKTPHEIWTTYDGRKAMEKDLKKLLQAI
ncbi:hypothetical protein P152DRAFT_404891 [Eremomyces bilateralis CBS 781.70]|uniref:Mitochondrial integral membrane protein n=1 Tax=Eremomyces bilateralis CBS 781.70 TaxID=1392243 RepID=A0A6G1FSN8_9PEZI|nr:uncharacterized protein P152DRAFT_404891 [Eremomyces bilateralis CBS 781.70]KAF1808692.1 hypothetical protein P152DRAFT_404891 [Eremomyces bilateralis CBS 781.70]